MKGEKRKTVDLPLDIFRVLESLAGSNRMPVKNYMERVLIGHVKDQKNKK